MRRHDSHGKLRLAIVVSHPIHYFVPLFRRLAADELIDPFVLFMSEEGVRERFNTELGRTYKWELDLVGGYRHAFLRNISPRPSVQRFAGLCNPGLVSAIVNGRFAAVIIFGWAHVSEWIAALAATLTRTPILLIGDSANIYRRPLMVRILKRMYLGLLFRCATAFLATGSLNRRFYEDYGVAAKRIFPVPWAVDNDWFRGVSTEVRGRRSHVLQSHGLPVDRPTIVFVGKLVPRKRPIDLLRSFAMVRRDRPCALAFVGSGPEEGTLRAIATHDAIPDVHFLGFLNQTATAQALAASDVFVLPSEQDPRATVTNEAMAVGLPVVISDGVGLWGDGDIVRHGDNGFVFPTGSVELLANALRELVADPELRRRMGRRSEEIISSWSHDVGVAGIRAALKFACRTAAPGRAS